MYVKSVYHTPLRFIYYVVIHYSQKGFVNKFAKPFVYTVQLNFRILIKEAFNASFGSLLKFRIVELKTGNALVCRNHGIQIFAILLHSHSQSGFIQAVFSGLVVISIYQCIQLITL